MQCLRHGPSGPISAGHSKRSRKNEVITAVASLTPASVPARARHFSAAWTDQLRSPSGFTERSRALGAQGFLPSPEPLQRLGPAYELWEKALDDLPKRIIAAGSGSLRRWLSELPPFPAAALAGNAPSEAELWRAMLLQSFFAHGYLWQEDGKTPDLLPASLAKPWCLLASCLQVPPILNYSTYILHNWRRLDPSKPIELGNIVCLNNFMGGLDEEWFRLVHVEIEAKAGPAVASIMPGQAAAAVGDTEGVERCLQCIAEGISAMCVTLGRMTEKCDPHIYYERVRLPTSGWRDNPAMPNGLLYEGVWAEPRQFHGASGAQSSIIPALDGALGVQHPAGWLRDYLATMRLHMPAQHRAFIAAVEVGPSLREYVQIHSELVPVYDACIERLTAFRQQHSAFARNFIAQRSGKAEGEKGTGGTLFTPALRAMKQATAEHAISR
ncbi:hypothetical protein WJX73_000491 [Symbiochloris irregularis]|uniref:Indoleamine 2,3-dioxygenase n=1 Tax=Symbiochloris irregularis TaxID=706552 RepID=A0AAW1P4H5_9CHLO